MLFNRGSFIEVKFNFESLLTTLEASCMFKVGVTVWFKICKITSEAQAFPHRPREIEQTWLWAELEKNITF